MTFQDLQGPSKTINTPQRHPGTVKDPQNPPPRSSRTVKTPQDLQGPLRPPECVPHAPREPETPMQLQTGQLVGTEDIWGGGIPVQVAQTMGGAGGV